ncbi:MAG: hypothetical protein KGI25_00875 [Thaumarchaeota archaeon]|nr:hypothetical protein [Nitrososphaerota archaeon]
MTVKNAIKYLNRLIDRRQEVLEKMKEHVSKMETDSGKDLGKTILQVIENDIENYQIILSELQPKGTVSNSKKKKKLNQTR